MPYIRLKKLKINNIDFNSLGGLQSSSSQIREIFHKDKILNQFINMSPETIPNYVIDSKNSTIYTYVSKEDVNKIVKLRTKDRCSIKEITQKVKLRRIIISTILSDKLKDTGSKYSTTHTYVSKEDVEELIQLRKENMSLHTIQEKLNLPKSRVSSILRGELENKSKQYKVNPFSIIYNKIILKIQPRRAVINEDDCYTFYQNVYKKVKKFTKYRNSSKLAPFTIFFYLKSRNVLFTTSDFIYAAGITQEEFLKGFKAIYPLCGKITQDINKAIIYSLIDLI